MVSKSMIIIGAGMGGLASGIYGQINGYQTQIFEMHSLPGGQCTSWQRAGYTFDACIHHLLGCSPEARLILVGEAPGREEVEQGRPFVGRAGQNLDAFLEMSGLDRSQMYITNVVKFRPTKISESGRASRTSLTIGLVAVAVSLVLGVILGGISGFYGGLADTLIQRVIEILRSIPTIPLWMGLAAAMPKHWSIMQVYFAITIIISLIGWTELARVVRGRFLSLREEDFVTAADLVGARQTRIIFVHMVPLFLSHIIAATTLALPAMIISETALSFLGLGLRAPAISWGVLLQQAQNVQTVALSPWLLLPAVPVILVILAFNFLGDGLRDAADPYS